MADAEEPADTMRGRVPGSRARLWLLLEADRRLVAALPLAAVFATIVGLGAAAPTPLREAMVGSDPVETLFQALLAATVTGVTLVVTINQLVLSQELGAVGDQRERMESAMAFREDAEAVIDDPVSPAAPAAFLRALVTAASDRAAAFRAAVEGDGELSQRADALAGELAEHADDVAGRLEPAEFGTFDVLFAALDFNYSWKVHEARRIRAAHGDELGEAAAAQLEGLLEALELFGPAREHVKTLYFQWELIDLSRAVLYAAVPALAVSVAAVLFLDDPAAVPGATAGVGHLVWVVAAAVAVALTPFALLLAYVLRIATVAKRTLAIGPFILRSSSRAD